MSFEHLHVPTAADDSAVRGASELSEQKACAAAVLPLSFFLTFLAVFLRLSDL